MSLPEFERYNVVVCVNLRRNKQTAANSKEPFIVIAPSVQFTFYVHNKYCTGFTVMESASVKVFRPINKLIYTFY